MSWVIRAPEVLWVRRACLVSMAKLACRAPLVCRVRLLPTAISELEVYRVRLDLRERQAYLVRRVLWVWRECGDALAPRATPGRWVCPGLQVLQDMPEPPVFPVLPVLPEPTAHRDLRVCGVFAARLAPRAWAGSAPRARQDSRV